MQFAFRRAGGLAVALVLTTSVVSLTSSAGSNNQKLANLGLTPMACFWVDTHQSRLGMSCPDVRFPDKAAPTGVTGTAHVDPTKLSRAQGPNAVSPPVPFGPNVDATNPNEDVSSGQSETAVAASGQYIVSAWNDVSGFLLDPSTTAGSITGVGFSADGGKTFTDVGGLPNPDICQQWFGDPSVTSTRGSDGSTFFYVTSLYLPTFANPCVSFDPVTGIHVKGYFGIVLSAGTVAPGGTSISFGPPVTVANGGNVQNLFTGAAPVNFLDKDFSAIDRSHGKIAVSYTCFGFGFFPTSGGCNFNGDITIALCDVTTPGSPACNPGLGGSDFMVVAQNPQATTGQFEVLQGSYPAFSNVGDLYVAWNQNFITNLFSFFFGQVDPFTHELAARIPGRCLTPPPNCGSPTAVMIEPTVKSLDATQIAGYSRFLGQDFPRIAFNNTTNQVVIVWNEANAHPLGDIVMAMASADLRTVNPKVIVNDDNSFALHFLPAVSVDANGNTNISWYDRRNADGTTMTDVFAASIAPGTRGAVNTRVTTVATEWNDTGSFISPNFGDYTDNTSDGTTFFVNWSDGRIGVPQSFVASATTH